MKNKAFKLVAVIAAVMCTLIALCIFASAEDAHEHVWSDEYFVIAAPTCTETGSEAKKCACGEYDTEHARMIPVIDHNYVQIGYKAAKCNEQGYKKLRCTMCQKVKTEILDYLPHSLGEFVTLKAATCAEDGKEEAVCSECGAHITRTIDKSTIPHTVVAVEAIPATCTGNGYTEGSKCSVCKIYFTLPPKVDPLGHDYGEPVAEEGMEPTCAAKGVGYITCSRCDDKIKVDIPKIPHVDADGDGICDVCEGHVCDCFCHYDTLASIFSRYINTFLNKLVKTNKYACCDDMEPLEGSLVSAIFDYIQRSITAKTEELSEKLTIPTSEEVTG